MKRTIIRIGNVADIGRGSSPRPITDKRYFENGEIPWIKIADATVSGKYIYKTKQYVNDLGASYSRKMKPGTLILSASGSLGIPHFLGVEGCIHDGWIYMDNIHDIDKQYLYYLLLTMRPYFDNLSYGAAIQNINTTILSKTKIEVPGIQSQEKIGLMLSAYDNLIENNNKRIKLLEQMAENLYKEWFVRFRFPGYEDTEFEDGMPRGWVREKIGLHYNTCSGGTPSRKHEEYYTEGTIPWVKTGEIKDGIIIHTDECITEAGIKGSSAKLLPQGAVVMAMYGVNIGMLAYLDSEMTCNQACCVFNDKNEINSRHYLFHYLYSIRDYLLLIGFGAAQQNLSQDLIKKVKIVIPPAELIKEFDKQKEPLYQTIRALMMQNDKLIKQRDALLPRLMSGKLEM